MEATQDSSEILQEFDAGVFAQKFSRALQDVALGVVTNSKVGSVVIQLDMKQIAHSDQVNVSHKLKYVKPTNHGKVTEENTTETPVYVGKGGKLTIFPDTQIDFLKSKEAV